MDSKNLQNNPIDLIKLMNSFVGDIKNFAVAIEHLTTKLGSLKENVDLLMEVVNTGDGGKGSIITRLAVVEKILEDQSEIQATKETGKWAIYVAIITGSLGLIASIVAGLFTYFK